MYANAMQGYITFRFPHRKVIVYKYVIRNATFNINDLN